MPFIKRASETIGLIRRAQREAEDVVETIDQTGARYRIDRQPDPGVGFRLAEIGIDGEPTAHRLAHLTDTRAGSSLYPETLPHLAGFDAFVDMDAASHTVVWTRPTTCHLPSISQGQQDFLQSPVIQQLTAKIKPLADRVRANDPEARVEIRAALQELQTNHPDVVGRLTEMWGAAFNDPASVAEHESKLGELTSQSIEAGWEVSGETRQEEPYREILVTLERGTRIRRLGLVHLGALQMLVLEEDETSP